MTSENTRRPTVAELAELDAGLVDGVEVDPRTAARLRADAAADPRSNGVLDALAATRADLAAAQLPEPPPAQRWSALFDATDVDATDPSDASADVPPDVSNDVVVPLARRRRAWRPALVAAAVLVAIAAAVGVTHERTVPEVSSGDLRAAVREAMRAPDAAGLDDPVRRAGCLRAAAPQLRPDAQLIGAMRVSLDGRPGVLLVLGTGTKGAFTIVVVDPECGPGGGRQLAAVTYP